jgi:hypothetical protein
VTGFGSGKQKAVMQNEKVIASRNLKDWTNFTTQIKDKTKNKVFLTRHFEAISRLY